MEGILLYYTGLVKLNEFPVLKNLLCKLYRRCLALDNHQRRKFPVVNQGIETQTTLSHKHLLFQGNQSLRIGAILHKKTHKVLPYPLFGRADYPLLAYIIENQRFARIFLQAKFVRWKTQPRPVHHFSLLIMKSAQTSKLVVTSVHT